MGNPTHLDVMKHHRYESFYIWHGPYGLLDVLFRGETMVCDVPYRFVGEQGSAVV